MNVVDLTIEEIKEHCTEQEKQIIEMYLNRDTQKKICSTLSINRYTMQERENEQCNILEIMN